MTHPTADSVADALAALRENTPLVQSLTNIVSANFVTNVLLAAGASNAHIDNVHEAAGFAAVAGGVLINLGTPDDGTAEAFELAADGAVAAGTPWVLDPVGVGGLPWRTQLAAELTTKSPTAIRGNASEIIALAGLGNSTRGVDSASDSGDAVPAAVTLLDRATAVSASGPVDYVVARGENGPIGVTVSGGSALLTKVTATGCSLGGLAAAYLAVAESPLLGLTAAHAHFAVASELAEHNSSGPGSFAVAFLDALASVSPEDLRTHAHIEPLNLGT